MHMPLLSTCCLRHLLLRFKLKHNIMFFPQHTRWSCYKWTSSCHKALNHDCRKEKENLVINYINACMRKCKVVILYELTEDKEKGIHPKNNG